VTVAILPPAYLSALGRAGLPSLRLLGTAGEAANPPMPRTTTGRSRT